MTTRNTIIHGAPDSILAGMFSGGHGVELDHNGQIFIDREGKFFHYIMEFIRDGVSLLPDGKQGKWIRQKVAREAEFYRLDGLLKLIRIQYRTDPPIRVDFDNMASILGDFEIEFTTLGASGRDGPTSLGTHYVGKRHEGQVGLTGGIQIWTVPADALFLITAYGATGGDSTENTVTRPGYGAKISASFYLNLGDEIHILVGQMGEIARGSSNRAGGGGGGTFVVNNGEPLVVAAGGNGCSWGSFTTNGIDALLEPRSSNVEQSNGRGGTGGSFNSDGRNQSSEVGGKSFTNGGQGGTGSYGNGGFGGGGGSQYEGGGGGGYQGGIVANDNSYSTPYPNYGATSFVADDGNVGEKVLHSQVSHGKVRITFVGV